MKTAKHNDWLYYKNSDGVEILCRYDGEKDNVHFNAREVYTFRNGVLDYESFSYFLSTAFTPATEEQRNEMLLRVAEAKGFVKGAVFKNTEGNAFTLDAVGICPDGALLGYEADMAIGEIYTPESGTWATIIKDEAEGESRCHQ